MHRIVVLSGAGVSAESGIQTFRDSDGLWEGYDVMEVASPIGFAKNPKLVLDFYNARREHALSAKPNAAHQRLAAWQSDIDVQIITQNIDDLHERAGSRNVLHLHGEIKLCRSTGPSQRLYPYDHPLKLGDKCPDGYQLRPHVVWFGEEVPMLEPAAQLVSSAEMLVIIGTSLSVYPAASLVHYTKPDVPIYLIDPNLKHASVGFTHIQEVASKGVTKLENELKIKGWLSTP